MTSVDDGYHKTIADLRGQLEDAYSKIGELKKLLMVQAHLYPVEFNLTKAEEAILSCLHSNDGVCRNGRLLFVLDEALGTDDCRTPDTIKVQICNLRKKLAAIGVKIKTVWGVGYAISAEDKKLIEAAITVRQKLPRRRKTCVYS